MAEGVASVGRQRVDMYYRNDPSEYSLKVAVTAKLLINTRIYKIHKTQNKECTKLYAVSCFSTIITLLP